MPRLVFESLTKDPNRRVEIVIRGTQPNSGDLYVFANSVCEMMVPNSEGQRVDEMFSECLFAAGRSYEFRRTNKHHPFPASWSHGTVTFYRDGDL